MAPPAIPEEARQLIERRIASVEMLDVLLLLHGSPGRAWTVLAGRGSTVTWGARRLSACTMIAASSSQVARAVGPAPPHGRGRLLYRRER